MTCEQIEPGQWRLSFNLPESDFVINTLAQLGRHPVHIQRGVDVLLGGRGCG